MHSEAQVTGNLGLHNLVAHDNCRKNNGARVAMYNACEKPVEVQDLHVAVQEVCGMAPSGSAA